MQIVYLAKFVVVVYSVSTGLTNADVVAAMGFVIFKPHAAIIAATVLFYLAKLIVWSIC